MKTLVAALTLFAAGCIEDEPVTVDTVIPRFDVKAPSDSLVADGRSPIEVEVCRADDPGVAKSLAASLKTSAGSWQISDADTKSATVTMSMTCESRLLTPPTAAGTLTLTATIESFTRTLPVTLKMAAIERVRLAREGALAMSGTSMLTITASLDAPNGGMPSIGTLVTFDVKDVAPNGGSAYFGERQVALVQGTSVQTNLYVGEDVTSLTVLATATADGLPDSTSEISITQ